MTKTLTAKEKDFLKRFENAISNNKEDNFKTTFLSKQVVTNFAFIYVCVIDEFNQPSFVVTFTSDEDEDEPIRIHGGIRTLEDSFLWKQRTLLDRIDKFVESEKKCQHI